MIASRRIFLIGSLLLSLIWIAWCVYFLPKGVDFTDEGLYCSDAWRLAQGDLPFRDSLAGFGLSFWWASLIFRIYPNVSLLELRIIWAIVMLLCALITAKLISRYFNPIISFLGAAVALFFATSGAIKILSYNTMPILGLILVCWLWLDSCNRSGKTQLLLAAGAGIAAFLATSCRISLLPIVLLPIITIAYDYCCGIKMEGRVPATIAFMVAYLGGLACFFLALHTADLSDAFFHSLTATTSTTGHSLTEQLFNFRDSFLYYLFPMLSILAIAFTIRFKATVVFIAEHKKTFTYIVFAILVVGIFILVLDWATLYKVLSWLKNDFAILIRGLFASTRSRNVLLPIAVALGIVMVDIVMHVFISNREKETLKEHDRRRLGLLAIFLFSLMILGTNTWKAPSVRYMSWLPVSMAFGLLWLWITERAQYTRISITRLQKGVVVLLAILCICYGLSPDRVPYRDSPIHQLNTMPNTTKLNNISTTSSRANTIDLLVEAIHIHSKENDRILAYEHLPMLYYLADRLPSTKMTWLSSSFPRTLREDILNDMLERNRLPQLVIRATYSTCHPNWPNAQVPINWGDNIPESDPIDKYVRANYRLIQEIEGFQLMVPTE